MSGSPGTRGRVLHLVRHGESTWNLRHLVQGSRPEPPLTELGRSQAAAAAAVLAERAVDSRHQLLFTSDQVRAVQTAEIIGAAIDLRPTPTPLLREQAWGDLEGLTTAAAIAALTDVDLTDPSFRWPGGGESTSDVRARVAELLESAAVTDANPVAEIILVSHGDTIRVLMAHLLGEGPAEAPWRQFGNGSVTTIRAALPAAGPGAQHGFGSRPPASPGSATREHSPS